MRKKRKPAGGTRKRTKHPRAAKVAKHGKSSATKGTGHKKPIAKKRKVRPRAAVPKTSGTKGKGYKKPIAKKRKPRQKVSVPKQATPAKKTPVGQRSKVAARPTPPTPETSSGTPRNEEEVKVKVVLPLLDELRIPRTDLRLEHTFFVRFGTRDVGIDGAALYEAQARLDILVKRGDKNLFVIETKGPDVSLDEDDRDQAISYARLVHPIAPYALVTNGAAWELYDTYSKERVTEATFDRNYSLALPNAERLDALRVFLRRSVDNIRVFSGHQVRDHMAPLLTPGPDRVGMYAPSLQVQRQEFIQAFKAFAASDKSLFALVGESGRGKTCSLCDLASSLVEEGKPVLFFRGIALERGIDEEVARELNWTFSDQQSPIEALKHLQTLDLGTPITLIVDAIDEWPYVQKPQNLLSLVRNIDASRFRVVVSCKSETWPAFVTDGGAPMGLDPFLHAPTQIIGAGGQPGRNATSHISASHEHLGFSPPEFHAAMSRYRRTYGFTGSFDDQTLAEAQRDPLLLRILFDVAAATGLPHLDLSTAAVLEHYLDQRATKTKHPRAKHILAAVARALFERNAEWIDERDLHSTLGLGINDPLEPTLFQHSLLLQRPAAGHTEVGFGLATLRNFLIAEHVCRWPSCDPPAFQTSIAKLQSSGLRAEVLTSYYRRASEGHRRIIDGESFEAAKEYLRYYRDTLATHFPSLWRAFPGCATESPAFYGEFHVSQRRLVSYGFRKSTAGTPAIFLRGVDGVDAFHSDRAAAYDYQVEGLQWAGDLTSDTADLHRKVVKNEIVGNLQELVQGGRLVEDSAPDLLVELLLAMIGRARSELGGGGSIGGVFWDFYDPKTRRPRFPIDFDTVLESRRRAEIARHLSDDLVEERRPPGQSWFHYTDEFRQELERRCQDAWTSGYTPPSDRRYIDVDRMKAWLPHAIEALRAHMPSIGRPLLPELPQGANSAQGELEAYFQEVHLRYLENYRRLVDANFPTLKAALPLYSSMPIRQHIVVEGTTPEGVTHLTILTAQEQPARNEVLIARAIEPPKDHPSMVFLVDGNPVEASSCSYTRHLLPPRYAGPDAPNPLSRRWDIQPTRLYPMPVRHLVYETLRRELPKLVDALRGACGVNG